MFFNGNIFGSAKKKETVCENNAANPSNEEEKMNDETVEDTDKVTDEDSEDKAVNDVGVEKTKTKTSNISLFGIGFLIFVGITAVYSVSNSISKILSSKSK